MLVKLSIILAFSSIASAVHTPPQTRAAAAKKEAEKRRHPDAPGSVRENYERLLDHIHGDEKRHDFEAHAPGDSKRQSAEGLDLGIRAEENKRRQIHPALIPGGVIEDVHELNAIVEEAEEGQDEEARAH